MTRTMTTLNCRQSVIALTDFPVFFSLEIHQHFCNGQLKNKISKEMTFDTGNSKSSKVQYPEKVF